MSKSNDWIELAYSSIRVFTDDGKLDMNELNFLLGIALKDNEIDEDEKRTLRSIFDKASGNELTPAVRERIQEVRNKYSI